MAPYQHNGFLGDDIKVWMENNRQHYIDLFNHAEKLNSDCYTALEKARPHNKDKRELTLSCLFPRTMELFQGTYLLISRGMIPSSNVILRTLIETMFVLVAVTKDNDALDAYILNDEAERLRTSNIVIHDQHSAILGIPIEDAERIKAEILEKQIRKWSVEKFAKKAGLYDWYLTVYAVLCGPVHAGIKDLEQCLNLDENNKVKSIEFVPTDKGATLILTTACNAQNMALHAFLTSLNLDTGIEDPRAEQIKTDNNIVSDTPTTPDIQSTQYDAEGYDKDGYDSNGFDKDGIHKLTGTKYSQTRLDRDGCNKWGYDIYGYDKNGFDKRGFNKQGHNKYTLTCFDKTGYDVNGRDSQGKDRQGYKKASGIIGMKGGDYRCKNNKLGFDNNETERESERIYSENFISDVSYAKSCNACGMSPCKCGGHL